MLHHAGCPYAGCHWAQRCLGERIERCLGRRLKRYDPALEREPVVKRLERRHLLALGGLG